MKNILFIEDNDNARFLTDRLLKKEGYNIFAVNNGIEGIKIYKKEITDLIITDLKMPDLDGFQVVSKIREIEKENIKKQVPIIILTGQLQPEEIKENNIHFILKPLDIECFLKKIIDLL